jgi:hypothetical protein
VAFDGSGDRGERANGEGGQAADARGDGSEPGACRSELVESGEVLDDRDAGREQDGVRGTFAGGGVVDVDRVDTHECGLAADQCLGAVGGEVGVGGVAIAFRPPAGVPPGAEQDGGALHCCLLDVRGADGALCRCVDDDQREVCAPFERETGEVVALREPVRRPVEVGAGVGDQADAADGELGALGVMGTRRSEREVVGDLRTREPGVGRHLVFDGVAEVDEVHGLIMVGACFGVMACRLVRTHGPRDFGGLRRAHRESYQRCSRVWCVAPGTEHWCTAGTGNQQW